MRKAGVRSVRNTWAEPVGRQSSPADRGSLGGRRKQRSGQDEEQPAGEPLLRFPAPTHTHTHTCGRQHIEKVKFASVRLSPYIGLYSVTYRPIYIIKLASWKTIMGFVFMLVPNWFNIKSWRPAYP